MKECNFMHNEIDKRRLMDMMCSSDRPWRKKETNEGERERGGVGYMNTSFS